MSLQVMCGECVAHDEYHRPHHYVSIGMIQSLTNVSLNNKMIVFANMDIVTFDIFERVIYSRDDLYCLQCETAHE